jgi:hypothetical protein
MEYVKDENSKDDEKPIKECSALSPALFGYDRSSYPLLGFSIPKLSELGPTPAIIPKSLA